MSEDAVTEPKPNTEPRTPAPRRVNPAAGLLGLIALAAIAAAAYWMMRAPVQEVQVGAPHGVIVVGAGALVVALVAQIRSMSVMDILETLWDAVVAAFGLLWAALKGIGNFILGLFGWD
ncbi:MAG: hypothetical protein BroJett024_01090 [Alphaproteobacteria bacterium]|nr:MAG: hypothetical protein BroJett024_01090 [Alphaproteobacteria bacterium]